MKKHKHDYEWSTYCGAKVCTDDDCAKHEGLVRCYCGWAEDGGNGRAQLESYGEQIDDDY